MAAHIDRCISATIFGGTITEISVGRDLLMIRVDAERLAV
jgi:hypothetical protein